MNGIEWVTSAWLGMVVDSSPECQLVSCEGRDDVRYERCEMKAIIYLNEHPIQSRQMG